jgi:hypothetical protein
VAHSDFWTRRSKWLVLVLPLLRNGRFDNRK